MSAGNGGAGSGSSGCAGSTIAMRQTPIRAFYHRLHTAGKEKAPRLPGSREESQAEMAAEAERQRAWDWFRKDQPPEAAARIRLGQAPARAEAMEVDRAGACRPWISIEASGSGLPSSVPIPRCSTSRAICSAGPKPFLACQGMR